MSSNSLVFHTFGGISSSPAAFLFLIFLSTAKIHRTTKNDVFSAPWLQPKKKKKFFQQAVSVPKNPVISFRR